mgnify:CR=1 FL=1
MTKYVIDQTHSDISFSVKYMMISSVSGCFNNYEATITADTKDFSDADFNCTIDIDSLYTGNTERDIHLKSSEFLDVKNFPTMFFKSKRAKIVDSEYILEGSLKIKEQNRDIELKGEYSGITIDSCGQQKYCFNFKTTVKRFSWFLDFVTKNSKTLLIDNDVELTLNLEFFKLEEQ